MLSSVCVVFCHTAATTRDHLGARCRCAMNVSLNDTRRHLCVYSLQRLRTCLRACSHIDFNLDFSLLLIVRSYICIFDGFVFFATYRHVSSHPPYITHVKHIELTRDDYTLCARSARSSCTIRCDINLMEFFAAVWAHASNADNDVATNAQCGPVAHRPNRVSVFRRARAQHHIK